MKVNYRQDNWPCLNICLSFVCLFVFVFAIHFALNIYCSTSLGSVTMRNISPGFWYTVGITKWPLANINLLGTNKLELKNMNFSAYYLISDTLRIKFLSSQRVFFLGGKWQMTHIVVAISVSLPSFLKVMYRMKSKIQHV